MPDFALELAAVQAVASLTEMNITNIRPGPDARGIDVLFDLDGRCVGAQHTTFHSDEGDSPGVRGSPTRAKEESIARGTTTAFGMFAKGDYRPALRLRIEEKIAKAAAHDNRDLIAGTWLVISASVNRWGAASSTLIAPAVLSADDLNVLCPITAPAKPLSQRSGGRAVRCNQRGHDRDDCDSSCSLYGLSCNDCGSDPSTPLQ